PESFKVLVKELNSLCLAVTPTSPVVKEEKLEIPTTEVPVEESELVPPQHVSTNAIADDTATPTQVDSTSSNDQNHLASAN
ncbi:hypothetical protein HY333_01280, partial [Candidatus Collierbacteria bacterium]|nr:hypothetical protein [Candidatus Collierbacteria bacterium]